MAGRMMCEDIARPGIGSVVPCFRLGGVPGSIAFPKNREGEVALQRNRESVDGAWTGGHGKGEKQNRSPVPQKHLTFPWTWV